MLFRSNFSDKELKRIKPIANKVLELEPEMQKLTDEELQAKTPYLKEKLKNGASLDDIPVSYTHLLCADSGLRQHPAGIRPDNASHARQHDCHGHQLCVQQPVDLWPVRLSCFGRSGCRYCHFPCMPDADAMS